MLIISDRIGSGAPGIARGVRNLRSLVSPAQGLVNAIKAFSPALLLLADLGTTQTGGPPSVAGDGTSITSNVAAWQDQSGNGNNALQATSTAQPRLIANAIGSRNLVSFDGLDDYLAYSPVTLNGMTLIGVGGEECFFGGSSTENIQMRVASGTQLYAFSQDGAGNVFSNAYAGALGTGIYCWSFAPSQVTFAYNSTSLGSFGFSPFEPGINIIGGLPSYAFFAATTVAALLIVPNSAVTAVTSLLASYYGIDL